MNFASPPNAKFLDATQYSVSWFWKRLQGDELEMQPPYQRNPVWQDHQKSLLIDSIIKGFPVPELYVQTTTTTDGDELHTLVDGQQRIRACMEFIAGRFALREDTPSLEGKYFQDLEDDMRSSIFRYKFVVRSLPDLTEAEVREIFGRLNRNNIALNGQELRHSTYWGEFISTMTELSQRPFWIKSGLFTTNDFRRMLDIEFVSELSVVALYGAQNKKARLDHYYGLFEDEFPDREWLTQAVDLVLAQLTALFPWPNNLRWSRRVDFYTLFSVLIERQIKEELKFGSTEDATQKLQELAEATSRILKIIDVNEEPDAQSEHRGAILYARGVRNSSDLGSRRLRAQGLRNFVWGDPIPERGNPENPVEALDRLASSEDLMETEQEESTDEQ